MSTKRAGYEAQLNEMKQLQDGGHHLEILDHPSGDRGKA